MEPSNPQVFSVPAMASRDSVRTISAQVRDVRGVVALEADTTRRTLRVHGPAEPAAVRAAIAAAGYTSGPSAARFRPLTPSEANGRAGELLGQLAARHGQVGSMVATMAHSSAVLSGYLDLSRAMKRATLARALGERVSIAVQARLGCHTCLRAHAEAARSVGVSEDEIDAAQSADSADPAVAALLRFAVTVLTEPARLGDADLVGLLEHGYSEEEVIDVVGVVALNQLTGSFNLVAGL